MRELAPALALLAALAFAVSPLLSAGFNGFEPGQFPVPQDDPPVQPAGYAFSIWGLIYLWLIAGAAIGFLRHAQAPGWQAMRPALILSLGAGAFWLPLAQVSVLWATALIVFMLITALAALLLAGREDRLWLREPIGLYAGWLTGVQRVEVRHGAVHGPVDGHRRHRAALPPRYPGLSGGCGLGAGRRDRLQPRAAQLAGARAGRARRRPSRHVNPASAALTRSRNTPAPAVNLSAAAGRQPDVSRESPPDLPRNPPRVKVNQFIRRPCAPPQSSPSGPPVRRKVSSHNSLLPRETRSRGWPADRPPPQSNA